ncbi:glycosyltransferase [Loigolactobacillus jiayinensis]|uniref:Glycosyltransferase n=1 Tax=Loigolactobacillus jiayinensis TaxID=2486016 RepID=A0ABW1RCA0_9LACO|nr:glycosyltransferase [Loigolactobacillus jiayinensis]
MEYNKIRLMIITQSEGGGLRRYITDVIDGLDNSKYEVALVYNSDYGDQKFKDWIQEKQNTHQIKLFDIKTFVREISLVNDLKTYRFLLQCIDDFEPTIVHVQSSKAGVIGRLAAKTKRIKQIYYTPHAYSFLSPEFSSIKKRIFILVEKIFSRYFTTFTFNVSQTEKEAALEYNIDRPNKFVVIPNGIPPLKRNYRSYAQDEMKVTDNEIIIGNVARFSNQKNPQLFVSIAVEALKQIKELKFVWIGSGELMNKMQLLVKKASIEKSFIFLGDRNDAEYLMDGFDIYLATSNFEGFSYSLLEAARAKLPVVAPKVPGIIDFSYIYKKTYLFNLHDSVDNICSLLYKSISDLDNPIEANILFSYEDMIDKITSYYEKKESYI